MRAEHFGLLKNSVIVIIVAVILGITGYYVYGISSMYPWAMIVFSVVASAVWLIVGLCISDTASLIIALRLSVEDAIELRNEIQRYREELKKNEKLKEFKEKLFKIFRGPRARLFVRHETVIAIFRKDGKGKYADSLDKIITPYGFHKHSLMNIRIANNIPHDKLLEAKKLIHEKMPEVNDVYFVRIPNSSLFIPVNVGKRVQQILQHVSGTQYTEDDFDRALLTKEIDINEWLRKIPLVDFLSQYDGERYPVLKDVLVENAMKILKKNLGTLSSASEAKIQQFLKRKHVSDQDATKFARSLVETFGLISNFVRIVEDHTYVPK